MSFGEANRRHGSACALVRLSMYGVLHAHQMLLLADFTKLTALGDGGVMWESSSLCGDDLKIVRVTSEAVEGIGYDPAKGAETRFAVEIKTGRPLT